MLESSIKQLIWARQQFERAVFKAKKALNNGNLLSVVVWTQIAADFAWKRHPGSYTSRTLESLLLEVAQRLNTQMATLPTGPWIQSKNKELGKKRILHIMTKAYRMGGHTQVVKGWIRNTADTSVHSLLTTDQLSPLPEGLASSIVTTGGWSQSLAALSSNLLNRSVLLQQISRKWADLVVLHVHPFDALPILAFGVRGGPPVILFNHADHVFWLGTSVADVVADLRPTGQQLTLTHRGIRNSRILPIPILKTNSGLSYETARKQLGIENDTPVLLTVGSEYKYTPFATYDFVSVMVKILRRNPKATLIAIGPRHHGRWAKASELVGGRIKAMGSIDRSDLELYYACTDIYLPSFPISGLTALLEAGLRGIPVIGLYIREAPILCGADAISLDTFDTHPSSLKEYTALVERMITEPTIRNQKGTEIKERIRAMHLSPGWNNFLDNIIRSLPIEHNVRLPDASNPPMDSTDIFLAGFEATHSSSRLVPHSLSTSARTHVRYLPTESQVRIFLEVLQRTNGVQTTKMLLYETALWGFDLLSPKMKLAIRENSFTRRFLRHIYKRV